jgi:hypothetical protein
MQLQAAVGGTDLQFGCPPLQPGCPGRGELTVQMLSDAVVEIGSGDIDFGG